MPVEHINDNVSLVGRIADVVGLRRDQPDKAPPQPAEGGLVGCEITPFPMADGLVRISGHCGKSCTREMLTAALPTSEGHLDHRLAPMALARAGIEGRWETRRLPEIHADDLPALLLMADGRALVLKANDGAGRLTVEGQEGVATISLHRLAPQYGGEVLLCGHVDPQNGTNAEGERAFIRRNPKMWILGSFLAERKRLVQLLGAAALLNLCALAVPLYMRAIYDRVVPNLALESLWALSVGIALVLVFEFLFKQIRGVFVDSVGLRVGQAVQHRAMSSLLNGRVDPAARKAGSLMTALRDVEALALLVPQAIVTFLVDVPFFFAYVMLIGLIGGWTMVGPLIGAVALMFVGMVAAHALKLNSAQSAKLMQARNNLIVDVAEGLTTIKANRAEGQFLLDWDVTSDHIGVRSQSTRKWNELPASATAFIVQLVTVLVVIIGVFQIKDQMMSTGALVAVTLLTGRAMVPVTAAISMISKGYQSLSQFAGLAQLLSIEPERATSDPTVKRQRIKGHVGLGKVTFTYPQSTTPSLVDVSLTIQPGEKIALIGKSGSGKSTLLQLLAGLVEPQTGMFTIDGHAVNHFATAQLRRDITYSAQDAVLFDASIWDNILLGIEEPEYDVVERAITGAGLDRFVSRSVEGYCRNVGHRGSRLSGGQRQAILLARALIRDPAILLLDEPTAAMDINSEQNVIRGLRAAAADRTMIVATHRMALLEIVDRVIWLDEGRVVADRPTQDVLAMMRNQKAAA